MLKKIILSIIKLNYNNFIKIISFYEEIWKNAYIGLSNCINFKKIILFISIYQVINSINNNTVKEKSSNGEISCCNIEWLYGVLVNNVKF